MSEIPEKCVDYPPATEVLDNGFENIVQEIVGEVIETATTYGNESPATSNKN